MVLTYIAIAIGAHLFLMATAGAGWLIMLGAWSGARALITWATRKR